MSNKILFCSTSLICACEQRMLWSDCAYKQARLRLCGLPMWYVSINILSYGCDFSVLASDCVNCLDNTTSVTYKSQKANMNRCG